MALNLMQQHRPPAPKKAEYYSGQWTKEEQDYVTCLVDGFKLGSLEIPDGTSLRFFIAAKLGCKPKRVSKKYERSGYNGKQVYRRDNNLSAEEQEAYRQRLKDCEKKFKDSRALVVSMHEAKTDSRQTTPTETPIITLHPSNASTLEHRLVAMRSQIDRASNMLGVGQPAAALNPFSVNQMLGGVPLNPVTGAAGGAGPMSTLEMRALMMQRQRAAAMARFSTGLPSAGLGTSSLYSSTVGPTNNKLLIDLYQRRQQLIMANMMAGGAGSGFASGAAAAMSAMGAGIPGPALPAPMTDKRSLEDLEAEEQARKRPRAA